LIAQIGHSEDVTVMASSPRGSLLATGSEDGTVKLWLAKTTQLVWTFSTSSYWVHSVAFSGDGCLLAAGGGDQKIYIWNLDEQRLVTTLEPHAGAAESLHFSADSSLLTASTTGHGITPPSPQTITWDVESWTKRSQSECHGCREFVQEIDQPRQFASSRASGVSAISYAGGYLAVGLREGQISVWDKSLRSPIRLFQQPILKFNGGVTAFSLDEDKKDLLSVGGDGGMVRWPLASGKILQIRPSLDTAREGRTIFYQREELGQVGLAPPRALTVQVIDETSPPPTEHVLASAISKSGMIATGGLFWTDDHSDVHGYVSLWSGAGTRIGDQIIDRNRQKLEVTNLSFSPDGKTLAIGFENGGIDLWNVPDGKLMSRLDEHERQITSLAFSAGGKYLASGSLDGSIKLWMLNSAGPARTLRGHASAVQCVVFSPDDSQDMLVSGGADNQIILWHVSSGERAGVFEGHTAPVNAVAFAPHGNVLVSGAEDATVRFWNTATFQPLATLVAAAGGTEWLAITPAWKQVVWQFDGNLFDVSPVEVGFRDYFVPNLLEKVLSDQPPAPTRSLASLNRTQPAVRILSVTPDGPGTVRVDVEADSQISTIQRDETGQPLMSGIYDLRLFRNGRFVAMWPESGSADAANDLDAWRREHTVTAGADGKATVSFRGIRLAKLSDEGKFALTAYAFNHDRVKSSTSAPFEYPSPRLPGKRLPRAYLITMGVNANQSGLNLDVAVPSAEKARSLLHAKLAERFFPVVDVPLNSDLGDDGSVKLKLARKAALKAALDLLAGKPVEPALREEFDSEHLLQAATPDDSVVLYIASHGYADPQGAMYVVPFDSGVTNLGITEDTLTSCVSHPASTNTCEHAQSFLEHTISSSDLSEWWKQVDAGEMVMILDTCHSGALPGKAFRPGPLGDSGFGQLSYDKKMILLSASQSTQTELGVFMPSGEGQTLLVDALVSVARDNPAQNLAQWLKGVENQLPVTMAKLYPHTNASDLQSPVLLDFSGSDVQAIATTPNEPAIPSQNSTGLQITVH
jgi:WD40 repeat protein